MLGLQFVVRHSGTVVDAQLRGQLPAARSCGVAGAGQAVHPVVGEDQLQGHLPGLANLAGCWSRPPCPRSPGRRRRPPGSGALDLHHADTAGADLVDVLQVAQGGDLDAGRAGGLQHWWCPQARCTGMPSIVKLIIFSSMFVTPSLISWKWRRSGSSPCRRRT